MRLMLAFVATTLSKHAMFRQSWRGLDHQDKRSRQTLKPDAVPTVFAFNSPPKRRKLSEARLSRAEHNAVVGELLAEKEPDSSEAEFLEPVTT